MMTDPSNDTLKVITELLDLPDIAVTELKTDITNREVTIKVVSTKEIIPCRQCARPTASHGCGRTLQLRHLPILGKKTTIEITPRRGHCHECDGGLNTTERLDWYEKIRLV